MMFDDENRGRRGETEEIAEAVLQLSLCIARAIHDIDPEAVRRMNFEAGLSYNRLIEDDRPLAAEMLYRFGRALLDSERFPSPDDERGG